MVMVLLWGMVPTVLPAQYNLEEIGIELGPGFVFLQNTAQAAVGPGGNANVFFSHYACGKGYGFHLSAGGAALFPATANGAHLIDLPAAQQTHFQFLALDIAALGKLRLHEYHRPREWAIFLGPRLQVPFLTHYGGKEGAGPLKNVTTTVNRLWPGIQLSIQFRRPAGKKTSWFVHPGATYFLVPAFTSGVAGTARPFYLFLNLGFQLWDQRG